MHPRFGDVLPVCPQKQVESDLGLPTRQVSSLEEQIIDLGRQQESAEFRPGTPISQTAVLRGPVRRQNIWDAWARFL